MIKKEVNLLVVGGAGAGLCAAVRAAEIGVDKILVIDKQPKMGGCTRMAQGMFSVGSPVQDRQGTKLTVDECFLFHMDMTNWEPDARLVRKWLTTTGKVVAWLESYCGVEFIEATPFSGPVEAYHMTAKPTGNEIVKQLLKKCEEFGIEMENNIRAEHLKTDEDGRVVGAIASKDGVSCDIDAKIVILATGSISANAELIKRFYGQDNDMSHVRIMANVPHNTGDGLIMAEEVGAANTPVSSLYIGPHNHPYNPRTALLIRRPHTIKINRDGERFTDEAMPLTRQWGWMMAVSLDRQAEKCCFALMDESILEYFTEHKQNYSALEMIHGTGHTDIKQDYGKDEAKSLNREKATSWLDNIRDDIASEVAAERIVICQTVDEIAEAIGCSEAVVARTIADYNRFCEDGYDAEFLKDPAYMLPLKKPPYYIFKAYQGIDTPTGGVRCNHELRVLNKALYPIPGLYAAGIMVGGWLGRNYGYFGSSMSFTTYSGYAAGENAANEILFDT
jgi:fumarate reductase flavoprotein subunit